MVWHDMVWVWICSDDGMDDLRILRPSFQLGQTRFEKFSERTIKAQIRLLDFAVSVVGLGLENVVSTMV